MHLVGHALRHTTAVARFNPLAPCSPRSQDGGGGGGGGDGWNWERVVLNVAPNLAAAGLYFFITTYGGDGFNNLQGKSIVADLTLA